MIVVIVHGELAALSDLPDESVGLLLIELPPDDRLGQEMAKAEAERVLKEGGQVVIAPTLADALLALRSAGEED